MLNSNGVLAVSLSIFLILLSGCEAQKDGSDLRADLEELVQDSVGDEVPGAIVYLDFPGEQISVAAGIAERSTGSLMDEMATLRLGSITKTYMAALTLTLVGEGAFALDDQVSNLLPSDVLGKLPNGLDPTIRQLLNHTSGIPDYYSERFYMEDWDRSQPLTPELVLHAIRGVPATITPGEAFSYSNTNYHVLALILEHVTGERAFDLLQQRILTPLALSGTFYDGPFPEGDTIHGYGSPFDPWEDTFAYRENSGPDGGMFGTTPDVARWIRALFSETGEFQNIGRQMAADPIAESARKFQGMGVEILESRSGDRVLGHTGAIDGYLSAAFYIPAKDAVLVIHINRSDEVAFKTILSQALKLVLS